MPNLKPNIATASNGNNIGTLVGAAIRPVNPEDQVASAYAFEINGGLHSYETISQRDQIIEERRDWGMLVNVYNNTSDPTKNGTYQLKYNYSNTDITSNNNWVIFSGGSGSGSGSAYWIDPVISVTSIEPLGPTDGDRYILGSSPTGTNWGVLSESLVVQWNSVNSVWDVTTPLDSMTVRVSDENNSIYIYETTSWVKEKQNQVVNVSATSSNGLSYTGVVDRLFSYETDSIFVVQFATSNSGTTFTMDVNGLGAKTVKQQTNYGIEDFTENEINTTVVYNLQYDGTYFRLNKPTSSPTLVRHKIQTDEVITVPAFQEYLLYGDLEVNGTLNIDNDGKVVIINGALNINGGTVSNSNNVSVVTFPFQMGAGFVNKYAEVVTLVAMVGKTIYHNLNTLDVTVTAWDETTQETIILTVHRNSVNDITVTSNTNLSSVRIVING